MGTHGNIVPKHNLGEGKMMPLNSMGIQRSVVPDYGVIADLRQGRIQNSTRTETVSTDTGTEY